MLKVFISQPMRGLTDEEIKKERLEATAWMREFLGGEEFEVIDSFFQSAPHEAKPLWFLGKSIELMSEADFILFLEGWEDARGCRIEHLCAHEYDKTIIYKINY